MPRPNRSRAPALAIKRLMDVAGALVGFVVLAPVLAWTALAIVVTSGRPVLFRQARPGLHGRLFTICKFRTMRQPRPDEVWYATDEQRVTRLGRFLRASSIDELPELWNVLRGEMSLVGPRPLLQEYLSTYSAAEARRHDLRPGITGWAAVNGRHALRFEDRLNLDTWYVDNWSLALDLRVIGMTIGQVLRRTDVETTQDLEEIGFRLDGVASAGMVHSNPGGSIPDAGPDARDRGRDLGGREAVTEPAGRDGEPDPDGPEARGEPGGRDADGV